MKYAFKPKGVCSTKITFDIEDGIITNIEFTGGCNGNLKAIGKLAEGMEADKLVSILAGNTCGFKSTSCADQLAAAVKLAVDGKL